MPAFSKAYGRGKRERGLRESRKGSGGDKWCKRPTELINEAIRDFSQSNFRVAVQAEAEAG